MLCNLQPSQTKTLKSIRTRGKHFCLIRMKPGSKDVTPLCSMSQWVAMMERRFANWLGFLSWANSHQNTQMTALACTGMTDLFMFLYLYIYMYNCMFVSALPDPTCNSEKSANGGNKQILLLLLLLLLAVFKNMNARSADKAGRFTVIRGCPHLVFRNQCLGAGTKWCCVHTLST